MSNIEKIRQEIERLIKVNTEYENEGYRFGLLDILSFIDSLPEEHLRDSTKMISEDLEEAAKEYMKKARKHLFDDSPIGRADDAFIAGAKWQKEQDTREMVMSDGSYFQKCYALGKKDMKEQMLKDAVEGEVVQDVYSRELRAKTKDLRKYNLKFGDKIKLIIIKD